jgi:hypothetical protein
MSIHTTARARYETRLASVWIQLQAARSAAVDIGDEGAAEDLLGMQMAIGSLQEAMLNPKPKRKRAPRSRAKQVSGDDDGGRAGAGLHLEDLPGGKNQAAMPLS